MLVLTWTPDHNATQLARGLGAVYLVPSPGRISLPAPMRYVIQSYRTILAIARLKPQVVIYQDPPFVTGIVLLVLRRFLRFRIWAFVHSATYNDRRWTRFRAFNRVIFRRCAGLIVHTELLIQWARSFGVPVVLLRYAGFAFLAEQTDNEPQEHILVPLSYCSDEPLHELLAAARSLPGIKIIMTGRAPGWVEVAAPANVQLTGWLDRPSYERLLSTARGVVALTRREHTPQMAAFEAVEHGVPLITSGTDALRAFHRAGAVFVDDHEPHTLAFAFATLSANHAHLRAAAEEARKHAIAESRTQVAQLIQAVRSL